MKRVRAQTIPGPIQELNRVQQFLNSVGRNSSNSKRIYGIGLGHFQSFLQDKYSPATIETILDALTGGKINVYSLIDAFVSHLLAKELSPNSIALYIGALRSYLAYHDIDIIQAKFKRKVKMPRGYHEDSEPLDVTDIRKILLSCNSRRLKAYLLVLASSGCRAVEALAIRIKDIDFTSSPVKINIRKEYAKTRTARHVYISDEAARYVQHEWLEWKYATRKGKVISAKPDDIVFSRRTSYHPERMYNNILLEFGKVLKVVGLDAKKEDMSRKQIGFHSLRRFVKTVASTESTDYSEWLLGHAKSPYWTMKEEQRKEIYKNLMPYLTFLDYSVLEIAGKSVDVRLEQKDRELARLRQDNKENKDAYLQLSDMVMKMSKELQELKEQRK